MRSFRLLFASILLGVTAGCSSNTTGTSTSNAPPPTPTSNDIGITIGAETKTTTAFSPNPKTVALGGAANVTLRWINEDITGGDYMNGSAVSHEIASDNGAFATSPILGGNATYSISLSTAGTYNYHCMIHPNMVGTITVTP